jgi:hypothetical protein
MKTSKQVLIKGRKAGWPDSAMAGLAGVSEETIRRTRVETGREMAWASLWPIYKNVIVDGVLWADLRVARSRYV